MGLEVSIMMARRRGIARRALGEPPVHSEEEMPEAESAPAQDESGTPPSRASFRFSSGAAQLQGERGEVASGWGSLPGDSAASEKPLPGEERSGRAGHETSPSEPNGRASKDVRREQEAKLPARVEGPLPMEKIPEAGLAGGGGPRAPGQLPSAYYQELQRRAEAKQEEARAFQEEAPAADWPAREEKTGMAGASAPLYSEENLPSLHGPAFWPKSDLQAGLSTGTVYRQPETGEERTAAAEAQGFTFQQTEMWQQLLQQLNEQRVRRQKSLWAIYSVCIVALLLNLASFSWSLALWHQLTVQEGTLGLLTRQRQATPGPYVPEERVSPPAGASQKPPQGAKDTHRQHSRRSTEGRVPPATAGGTPATP
jgi:hypothetical protein